MLIDLYLSAKKGENKNLFKKIKSVRVLKVLQSLFQPAKIRNHKIKKS